MNKISRKRFYDGERIFKGAANHRRLEILLLLSGCTNLSTEELVDELGIHYQTASEHLNRLVRSGLVGKHRDANIVRYELLPTGRSIINLWKKL